MDEVDRVISTVNLEKFPGIYCMIQKKKKREKARENQNSN